MEEPPSRLFFFFYLHSRTAFPAMTTGKMTLLLPQQTLHLGSGSFCLKISLGLCSANIPFFLWYHFFLLTFWIISIIMSLTSLILKQTKHCRDSKPLPHFSTSLHSKTASSSVLSIVAISTSLPPVLCSIRSKSSPVSWLNLLRSPRTHILLKLLVNFCLPLI